MKSYKWSKSLGSIAICIFTSAMLPSVQAQQRNSDDLLDAVGRCQADRDDARRLACFDAAATALVAARANHGLVALSQEQMREREQAKFGLNPNRPVPTSGPAGFPTIETLESKVTHVRPSARDLFVVTLADGSVWRTTEPARRDPATGEAVRIRRGALGSYLGSFAGMRSVRIERLR